MSWPRSIYSRRRECFVILFFIASSRIGALPLVPAAAVGNSSVSASDDDWIQLARLTLANYALTKAAGAPNDVFCSRVGTKENGCHCWNDKGNAEDDGDDCNSPKECLIYSTKQEGNFSTAKVNTSEDVNKTLSAWRVPPKMVQSFNLAMLTENATFTTFDFVLNPGTAHYEAHVGTARLHDNQRFIGYTYGVSNGSLVQPYIRTVRAGDCHGTKRGQKQRGYRSAELDSIREGLASTAFKEAASRASPSEAQSQKQAWEEDEEETEEEKAEKRVADFLEKWADVVEIPNVGDWNAGGRRSQVPPAPGGGPFQSLFDIIQQITGAWQSIVNAFKSSYSQQIVDKEFNNGWDKFKASTRTFKGAGLAYDRANEFFADIRGMLQIPPQYAKDFDQQIKWIQFFDNTTWSSHNTQYSAGKAGGTDTVFTMFAKNRQEDQKLDVLFLTCSQEFHKADNYFVISESRSILGGIWSSTTLKFKHIPAGITDQDLMFVADYFQLLAYQQIALASGEKAPPDPQFPGSPTGKEQLVV